MDSVFALKAVLYPGNQSWDKTKNSIIFLDTLKSESPRISHCRERKGMKGTQAITPSSNKFCQTKCRCRKAWNELGGGFWELKILPRTLPSELLRCIAESEGECQRQKSDIWGMKWGKALPWKVSGQSAGSSM